jgi:hypothetical protein
MKKVIAIAFVTMFMLGTVAFAEDAAKPAAAPVQKESMVRKFFGDSKDLVTKQIPETKKSATNRMFERTDKKSASCSAK